ncbi:MAG: PaaI family thioesterase [Ectothiorhodospiraceae bacterium]|nr:PaaI family thioesterase [Chromatiales bacterium]MCP5155528.1 PaaI family thioesterase [Ectothiorhodospiraceae bacterium]
MLDNSPFIAFCNMRCEAVDPERDEIRMRMPVRPELERLPGSGQFHGGPIASLVDVAGDFALAIALGGGVPTINFRTDFLRPATGASLLAVARVRRAGRTVGVVDVDVLDEAERLVAVGRGCYSTKVG